MRSSFYFYAMQNVLITGGSGLIGRALSSMLQSKGYKVSWLSHYQHPRSEYSCFAWDIDNAYIDEKAFENVDFIVHLAGAGIADKGGQKLKKRSSLTVVWHQQNYYFHIFKN